MSAITLTPAQFDTLAKETLTGPVAADVQIRDGINVVKLDHPVGVIEARQGDSFAVIDREGRVVEGT